MRIYLVGGAVRDQLLGLPIKERDWVVVGASPEELLQQGFKAVGKDFPVFLHPQTHEEYALARTERKVGPGYKGFTFYAAPDVTLEQDLQRRDLRINAIAQDPNTCELIDPYAGQTDLNNKLLRHVSIAFREDPVRILRTARFAARFSSLGFTVAPDTMQLMHDMVVAGEVDALVAERVWQEWVRALAEATPIAFFVVLQECGAFTVLFPDIYLPKFTLPFLQRATQLSHHTVIRFAALMLDFSQANDNNINIALVKKLCQHYRVPNEYSELAILAVRFRTAIQHAKLLSATDLLNLLENVDAIRRPERFSNQLLLACEASFIAIENHHYSRDYLITARNTISEITAQSLADTTLSGIELGKAIKQARINALETLLSRP